MTEVIREKSGAPVMPLPENLDPDKTPDPVMETTAAVADEPAPAAAEDVPAAEPARKKPGRKPGAKKTANK